MAEDQDRKVKELWLRRQAIQCAANLPEDTEQALAVLEYARELITDFVAAPKTAKQQHLSVVTDFRGRKD